ncbi:MAG: hypothetical protein M3Y87_19960 [Myxococcota bacterium]|nr:hypothetical protein [Myxococcota bacterium]
MACVLAACTPEPLCRAPAVIDEPMTFLVSRLSIDEVSGSGARATAQGFDLDGVSSTGAGRTCVELTPDHRLAPDGDVSGIDNASALLVPTMEQLIDDVVDRDDPLRFGAAIADGRIVLLIQLSASADEPGTDPILRVFRGTPLDGALVLDADGRPVPDQRFRGELVAEGAFASAGAARRAAVVERFAATLADPSPAPPLDLARLTHVGLDECAGVGLRGRLGGSWAPDDAATWLRRLGRDDLAEGAASSVAGVTDLQPDPIDPNLCGRFSLGISFDVVAAELVE